PDAAVRLAVLVWRGRGGAVVPWMRRGGHPRAPGELWEVPAQTPAGGLPGGGRAGGPPGWVLWAGGGARGATGGTRGCRCGVGRELLDGPVVGNGIGRLVLPRLDVDALRRADRGAHVAGHASGLAVVPGHQPVESAVPGRVGRLLLGVADRGDEVQALPVHHL